MISEILSVANNIIIGLICTFIVGFGFNDSPYDEKMLIYIWLGWSIVSGYFYLIHIFKDEKSGFINNLIDTYGGIIFSPFLMYFLAIICMLILLIGNSLKKSL